MVRTPAKLDSRQRLRHVNTSDGEKARRKSVQHVIHQDLAHLAIQFSTELRQEQSILTNNGTTSFGSSFQIFLRIFNRENVALIHTQVLPPRCDSECFAQLLSASCLQFVERNWGNFTHVAFAIFSLYAFFQASPLPILRDFSSSTPSSCWTWLSMGLVHPDNPKLGYRRRFRQRIRINRGNFVMIQRLRHACIGRCYKSSDGLNKSLDLRCSNHEQKQIAALAMDVLEVLNRLEFEWCEYHGPRGLDALAVTMINGCNLATTLEKDAIAEIAEETEAADDGLIRSTIDDVLKHYHSKLQAIEVIATTQQAKRVKAVLQELSGKYSWEDLMSKSNVRTLQEVTENESVNVIEIPLTVNPASNVPDADVALKNSFRIRFPPSVSSSLQQHVTSAIIELLQRGDSIFLPQAHATEETDLIQPVTIATTTPSCRHDNFLMTEDEVQPCFDSDMSDVSDDDVQYAIEKVNTYSISDDNSESAAGLDALNILLNQAKSSRMNRRKKNWKDALPGATSAAESCIASHQVADTSPERKGDGEPLDDSTTRSKNYIAGNTDMSIAGSSVGHQALSSLLKQGNEKRSPKLTSRHRNPVPRRGYRLQKDENKKLAMTREKAVNEGVNARMPVIHCSKSATNSIEGDEALSVAASSVGHLALSSLLKQVNEKGISKRTTKTRQNVSRGVRQPHNNDSSKQMSKRVKSTKKTLHSDGHVDHDSVNPTSHVAEDEAQSAAVSVCESSVGRLALSTLLQNVSKGVISTRLTEETTLTMENRSAHPSEVTRGDGNSIAASSVGHLALSSMLNDAAKKSAVKPTSGETKDAAGGSDNASISPTNSVADYEEMSVAASSFGHQALSSLLKQGNAKPAPKLRRSPRNPVPRLVCRLQNDKNKKVLRKRKMAVNEAVNVALPVDQSSKNTTDSITGDGALSVAASSVGHLALSSLLKQVNDKRIAQGTTKSRQKVSPHVRQLDESSNQMSRCMKTANKTLHSDEFVDQDSVNPTSSVAEDEAQSVAASSIGHLALSTLLHHANMKDNSKKRKSTSYDRLPQNDKDLKSPRKRKKQE